MAERRVLFVIPPYLVLRTGYAQRSFLAPPYGALSIISYVRRSPVGAACDMDVFDCNLHDDWAHELIERMRAYGPSAIGISLMFDRSYIHLGTIVRIAESYGATVLVGGAAATPNWKQILDEHPGVDAVCCGDGEVPFARYAATDRLDEPAWATAASANPRKESVASLDACIDLDYSLLDVGPYQDSMEEAYSPYQFGRRGKRQFIVVTSRGCPYSCTFCTNSLNPDKSIRYASVPAIVAHVEKLVGSHGMNVLTFYDEHLLFHVERAKELFRQLRRFNLRIEMPNGISPACLDEEMLDLMRVAGVDSLYLAIESGSRDVLRMMRKPVDLDQVRRIMPIIRAKGFFVYVFLLLGMPEETDAHRAETIAFVREIRPDLISPKPVAPVYGSRLRQECIEKGYVSAARCRLGAFEITDSVIEMPGRSAADIQRFAMLMNYRTNFVENYRMAIGDYLEAAHYFRHVASRYPHEIFAHYYLAQAMDKLGEPGADAERRMVAQLMDEGRNREAFAYFGLPTGTANA